MLASGLFTGQCDDAVNEPVALAASYWQGGFSVLLCARTLFLSERRRCKPDPWLRLR